MYFLITAVLVIFSFQRNDTNNIITMYSINRYFDKDIEMENMNKLQMKSYV